PFMEAVIKKVAQIKRGDPLDTDTMVGAQASQQQFDKIMSYLEIAKGEGAEVLTGGAAEKLEGSLATGYYIQPTLLKGTNQMRVFQEEIFGPVMSILTYETEEEVIRRANDTDYGLAAGVCTNDITRAHRIIHKLEAGICWINAWGESPAEMPVGGYKQSGVGRENGVSSLAQYTRIKSVQVELGGYNSVF
ncbi:MAG TPA: betaine-aldehyde dehydrogenase, partial [Pseudomonas sp.]|nr:betaine-aldehyde dehydrogenase [Pseudomonas sp.]